MVSQWLSRRHYLSFSRGFSSKAIYSTLCTNGHFKRPAQGCGDDSLLLVTLQSTCLTQTEASSPKPQQPAANNPSPWKPYRQPQDIWAETLSYQAWLWLTHQSNQHTVDLQPDHRVFRLCVPSNIMMQALSPSLDCAGHAVWHISSCPADVGLWRLLREGTCCHSMKYRPWRPTTEICWHLNVPKTVTQHALGGR